MNKSGSRNSADRSMSTRQVHRITIEDMELVLGTKKRSSNEKWITQFCSSPNNSWFIQVDTDWIADWFNQYGISPSFTRFDEAIQLITDDTGSRWLKYTKDDILEIHSQAIAIYGIMHSRYICQPRGLELMKEKYEKGTYGYCPRYNCKKTKLLPVGTTHVIRRHTVKLYCPCCCDIYRSPANMSIDGVYFGSAFPHIFLTEFKEFNRIARFKPFVHHAFGFKAIKSVINSPSPHDTNIHEEEILD